jgi:NAD(P)-dependent dehydrogenase (short-subunit alcohol dehydrogenase family)
MSRLETFTGAANVAVIGASGGIGGAICAQLAADPAIGRIFAFARRPVELQHPTILPGQIDIENEASIAGAAESVGETPLDLVLVLTGLLHDGEAIQPERQLSDLDPVAMSKVLSVNTIGPAIVAKHFLPKLRRRGKTVFAALSARVGSIGDNRLGGWTSYRASKAALNQVIRTLSIEQARKKPESIVVALHPGTVDTPLSKPFTSRTPTDKLFAAEQSAAYLLSVVDGLDADDSGGFFAWDGVSIEY